MAQESRLSWALSTKLVPPPPDNSATADNADLYYAPYLPRHQETGDSSHGADEFYPHYYPQPQEQDPWARYYAALPTHNRAEQYPGPAPALPTHSKGAKYPGPAPAPTLPVLGAGLQYAGPRDLGHEIGGEQTADNEVFDVPRVLLKSFY